jgi:hypothetical protein
VGFGRGTPSVSQEKYDLRALWRWLHELQSDASMWIIAESISATARENLAKGELVSKERIETAKNMRARLEAGLPRVRELLAARGHFAAVVLHRNDGSTVTLDPIEEFFSRPRDVAYELARQIGQLRDDVHEQMRREDERELEAATAAAARKAAARKAAIQPRAVTAGPAPAPLERPPSNRAQIVSAIAALVLMILGVATFVRSCGGDKIEVHRDGRVARPNQKPISADGSTTAAATASARSHASVTPPAPVVSAKP